MKNIFLAITAAGLLFTACNNSNQPEKDASLVSPATEVSTVPPAVNGVASELTSNQVQPMPTTTTPAPGVLTAGLNPEHGQPNHRCDIPVGAPLSSPAPAATQAPVSTPAPTTIQPTMPNTVLPATGASSGKINPPHGQPGHSCSVAVGAMLP